MKKRGSGLFIYAFLYLAFLYLPVLFLPLFSFNNSMFIAFPLTGFTTQWYRAAVRRPGHAARAGQQPEGRRRGRARSRPCWALLAAKAVTRYRCRARGALLGFISLPLFIPDIVLGISLLHAAGRGAAFRCRWSRS